MRSSVSMPSWGTPWMMVVTIVPMMVIIVSTHGRCCDCCYKKKIISKILSIFFVWLTVCFPIYLDSQLLVSLIYQNINCISKGYEFSHSSCCSVSCLICFFLANICAALCIPITMLTFVMIDTWFKIKPNNGICWTMRFCCLLCAELL